MPESLGQLDDEHLHQRRAADGLLHPQLAPLHPAGQADFAFPGQEGNGAHFAQVHANRVIRVNGFLDRLAGLRVIAFLNFLGVEEIGILVERNPERLSMVAV